MDFAGFEISDFDFFKKKGIMSKTEYDEKKEEVKRHFRGLCYQIQKNYHSNTGKTLIIDKDFQGLSKNKNFIIAKIQLQGLGYLGLNIVMGPDNLNINLVCPPDDDADNYQKFKEIIISKKHMFIRFFKENKNMFIMLSKRNYRKPNDVCWEEIYKFDNNELCYGDYNLLVENMEKLQPFPVDNKKIAGFHIRVQYGKTDVTKLSRQFPVRVCSEIVKLLNLCDALVEN